MHVEIAKPLQIVRPDTNVIYFHDFAIVFVNKVKFTKGFYIEPYPLLKNLYSYRLFAENGITYGNFTTFGFYELYCY